MALFVAIIIHHPREIFFETFRPCVVGSHITSSSRGIKTGVLLFVFLFLKPLFRLFPSFFGGLCITKRIIYGLEVLALWLRFFNSRVFHGSALSLYLGRGDVNKTMALLSLVVHLPNIRNRLETCFGLSLDCFLDYFFTSVLFSTCLFYLSLYGGFKAFPDKYNKVKLFWSPVIIKL